MGVLYDQTALDAAWDLVKDWTIAEHDAVRAAVPRLGLRTPFRDTTLQVLAQRMVAIADAGLKARRQLDAQGRDETMYLDPLRRIADSGITLAEEKGQRVARDFGGDASALYEAYAY
jgi:glutamate--cysteine ligase